MAEQTTTPDTATEHVDVLIVGAGLSGIGAAWHLQDRCPTKSYAILEARDAIGGTWDLFRYPGIRSDSDMYTLGYRFKPWTGTKALADGPAIREYVTETARENGIDEHIRFGHKVLRASWSSPDARWTVECERTDTGETVTLTANVLLSNSGYYRYDEGYTPHFEGRERFRGEIVHPQSWPEDLDYAGKRVVVIGSGATAVTLVPAMAASGAEHVTMLQRSPTYILPIPEEDPFAKLLRPLPDKVSYPIIRWKNVGLFTANYRLSQRFPNAMRKLIRAINKKLLPKGYDVDTHFKPKYGPWDQRLCVVPDSDLFRAIRSEKASVATGRIDTFTEKGVLLESGEEIEADIIVTATGLNLLAFGGMELVVDGKEIHLPETMAYKGMMLSGIPNFVYTIGYTNISWTLKADLVSEYACRLINHMDATGTDTVVPVLDDPDVVEEPFMDFAAGYVLRSIDEFPKQGSKSPWKLNMNYPLDLRLIRHGALEDDGLQFRSSTTVRRAEDERPLTAA